MRRQSGSFQHALLRLIAIILGILLTIMVAVTVYFQQMMNRIHYVEQDAPTFSLAENLTQLLPAVQEEAPASDTCLIGGKDSDLVNILLIGQDRRPEEDRARSDTMILCTFNKNTKEVTLTSFLRDLYVSIPGYQDNRINAAYVYGGSSLLQQTLADNFGIYVDGCVEVDFTQFSQIIDLLGGVSMELRQDEADAINQTIPGSLTAGEQWLSGSQALAYSRIRNLDGDGDFSRTNRQRKLIAALVESYKDADIRAIVSLVSEALPMITTDMRKGTMLRYAKDLFPLLSGAEIVSQQIPAEGMYHYETIQDMSVLIADMERTQQLLLDTLTGRTG